MNKAVKIKLLIFGLCAFCTCLLPGQIPDLGEGLFLRLLVDNHPRSMRADLQREVGRQEVVAARGLFDPVIGGTYYTKTFKDQLYYSKIDAGILQPITWLGMDIQGGLELNRGNFLNPEQNTPASGLAYLGLRLPLLQGLSIDKRRTDLRLANLFQERTDIQYIDVQNKLIFDGLRAYWNWVKVRQRIALLDDVLENNRIVLEGIKAGFFQGDKPAIDTVEAFQQYQRIRNQYNRELVSLQNAAAQVQVFMFGEDARPLKLTPNALSADFEESLVYFPEYAQLMSMDNILDLHPNITLLRNESDRLSTQLRWERERLKPRLDVHYNLLADSGMSPLEQSFLNDNYQAAVVLSFPLLFRNARGRTEQFKIFERQNQLDLADEYNFLTNVVEASRFELENLKEQVEIAESITNDTKRLYDAEIVRFGLGESSVFLVNMRELQYISAQTTLIDLKTDAVIQSYRLLFDLGVLYRVSE